MVRAVNVYLISLLPFFSFESIKVSSKLHSPFEFLVSHQEHSSSGLWMVSEGTIVNLHYLHHSLMLIYMAQVICA